MRHAKLLSGGLEDCFRQLGLDAKDALVARLQQQGTLRDVRLACRALRECVDGSIRRISIAVSKDTREQWEAQPLPLSAWPRCSSINLSLTARCQEDHARLNSLLAVAFAGQPLEARSHITQLSVWWPAAIVQDDQPPPELTLALLIHTFPRLRHVTLRGLLSHDLPMQQLLYDALAGLAHLDELTLTSCCALDRASGLAPRLRRLSVCVPLVVPGPGASRELALSSLQPVASLQQLRHLSVELQDSDPAALQQLLASMPHTVETLELPNCAVLFPDCREHGAVVGLDRGRVTWLEAGPVCLEGLGRFVTGALQPSGAMAPQLERLTLRELRLCSPAAPAAAAAAEAAAAGDGQEVAPLRWLLARCPHAECRGPSERVAVEAAARGIGESAAAVAAVLRGTGPVLKVLPAAAAAAPVPPSGGGAGRPLPPSVEDALVDSLCEVAQRAWEGEGVGAEWGEPERLEWLLEQWEQLCHLPPFETL
ncbi:hypothetical protein GPECTOR_33g645 [Gonium pectorale]|uniref:F-box domain-containing protein n=1 Tax=Gonium pectorale TaxID=33097 RepID=A0A150GDB0_GONPE|nr:hypothetical protein GPECTOR_33g645 [Gonium pectorale]|eukprot:KXZ47763.1 hypothetical protein GPECTOR_33g645 [Gonium pectorale]